MTKEQIEYAIEMFKNKEITKFSDFCKKRMCSKCPFRQEDVTFCGYDSNKVIVELIDRLLKTEEKVETNLEHYWRTSYEVDGGESYFVSVESSKKANDAFHLGDMKEWLLSPYEKPRYKLTKFEYDLLKAISISLAFPSTGNVEYCLEIMQDKGYFKGVPFDISFKEILDNCEEIQND